jgi:outer membrane lipoprotein SlyB
VSEVKSNQYLWVAVGVLGVATLGLGAELLASRTNEAATHDPVVLMAVNEPAGAKTAEIKPDTVPVNTSLGDKETVTNKSAIQSPAAHKNVQKPKAVTAAKVESKPAAIHQDAKAEPEPPLAAKPASMPEQKPPLIICNVCGTVESVTAVERDAAQGSGIGVIAGAALGGIVGNQFGGGTGKDLATIAGMAAGGWAGNTVEKKIKKEVLYEVKVRMEDGSLRKLEQKASIGVGTKVTVEGGKLTPA